MNISFNKISDIQMFFSFTNTLLSSIWIFFCCCYSMSTNIYYTISTKSTITSITFIIFTLNTINYFLLRCIKISNSTSSNCTLNWSCSWKSPTWSTWTLIYYVTNDSTFSMINCTWCLWFSKHFIFHLWFRSFRCFSC